LTIYLRAFKPVGAERRAALRGRYGSGSRLDECDLLTLGTGVGGAAMVDGHLLKGAIGRAGHLGHLVLDLAGPPDICNTPGSPNGRSATAILERTQAGSRPPTISQSR
jgi:glucokinase